jgi:hypothetical protein
MFDFSIKTRGIEELDETFKSLPLRLRGVAAEGASEYLIGTPQRGLKHYPGYKSISRSSVYRPPYQSDRQRRFVMAGIRSGRIEPGYPHRTGNYQRSWRRVGSGVNTRIAGEMPHDNWPDPLARKIGWRDPMEIIDSNINGAAREAERAVQAEIDKKGLG